MALTGLLLEEAGEIGRVLLYCRGYSVSRLERLIFFSDAAAAVASDGVRPAEQSRTLTLSFLLLNRAFKKTLSCCYLFEEAIPSNNSEEDVDCDKD